MTTGNGNRSWRDRLGLQEQDEALPKLSDQFDDGQKTEGRVPPPAAGSAADGDVALAEPEEAVSAPKRVLPPPPPADDNSERNGTDTGVSAGSRGEPSSPAAKTFADRLRARREAAEKAGTATTEGLGSGLHLRPPENGIVDEVADAEEDRSSRIIPPPSVPKPDPEPKPAVAERVARPAPEPELVPEPVRAEPRRAEDRGAREPLFEPIERKERESSRSFEKAPFKADAPARDDYSSFDRPAGAPRETDVSLPRFRAKVENEAAAPPPIPGNAGYGDASRLPTGAPDFSARTYERPERPSTQRPIQQEYTGDYAQDDGLYDDTWYEDDRQAGYQGAHARALDNVDGIRGEAPRRRPELGRPSASDYADAYYDDYDEQYEDDEPQGRGPWMLFAGLACVGLIAAALIWFYLQSQQGSSTASTSTPVVTAPTAKVKVDPPKPSSVPAAQQTKLFYDRIVGESTVEGERLLPREEQPLDPGAATSAPATDSGTTTEPQPLQPLTPDQLDTGDLPVPLPPPLPGSTSGSIEPAGSNKTTNIAQSSPSTGTTSVAKVDQSQTVEPAGLTTTLPLPGSDSDAEATQLPQLQPLKGTDDSGVEKAVTSLPGAVVPRPRPKPASVVRAGQNRAKTTRVASVSPITAAPTEPLSITPLPGSQPRPVKPVTTPSFGATQNAPSAVSSFQQGSQATQGQSVVAAVQQPAPVPAPVPTAPAAAATGTGGYVVQLASYKDEASAMNGYQQLRTRHPSLLGSYRPLISKKAVGSFGTFYRLQVGPIASAQSGNQICSSLLAAGEKDCLVKRR